jgi:hypothetical protein
VIRSEVTPGRELRLRAGADVPTMIGLTDRKLDGHILLVGHCLALGFQPERPSAMDRLEELLGPDLTQRLVFALTRANDS